jgi:hypothetical protein
LSETASTVGSMLLDALAVTPQEFAGGTGWEIKPEGACEGSICVPLPFGDFDVASTAATLGMATVHDSDVGIGPETLSGKALATAGAPNLILPDLDGNDFELRSLRGQKVAIVSWAPY